VIVDAEAPTGKSITRFTHFKKRGVFRSRNQQDDHEHPKRLWNATDSYAKGAQKINTSSQLELGVPKTRIQNIFFIFFGNCFE
jgi:hypothetical protein